MSDQTSTALRKRLRYISPVWLVPLIALLIGAWMLYHSLSEQGPEVTLIMDSAEGIESGRTLIKARNVEVGHVTSVTLSDDTQHAVVKARMNNNTERLLNNGTRFWVVKPRIGREGISGLGTVLSGNYIQLQPGHGDKEKYTFQMLDQPPVAPPDAQGLRLHLSSTMAGSLSVGDPVLFNGYTVGRVEKVNFDADDRQVHYQLFIQAPYEKLVTTNTRFWSAAGFNFDVNSEGFSLNLDSLESLVSGGVAFGVPEDIPPGDPIGQESDLDFTLYADRDSAYQGSFNYNLRYVVLIDDTVRGLNPGAPVEYRGVRVGTVDSVPWHIDKLSQSSLNSFKIPVLIRIEPQRLQARVDKPALEEWRKRMQHMFDNGLRASLKTGNLFTGQLFVDTNFVDDPSAPAAKAYDGVPVFPSQPSGFAQIEQKVTALLDKLNGLDVNGTVNRLNQTLAQSDQLLSELGDTADTLNQVLNQRSTQELPNELKNTLQSIQQTLQGYSRNAPAYDQLTSTLKELNQLMHSLQPAARTLSEKPNSLIFNRDEIHDPQPRAPQ
ncbi:intermembrane transport protein PqiB [Kushneria phosphatilytica]|uniref:Intermembrane transport protein PqiB n=1 Tax=Kushneria phosphatilytica TaxID=657387 RepID=A0A1S1NTF6_9GAMM|nr:intermembrane transport protein PqiB [Kushneria phosphatilytica]OHV08903.1 mammalian cell entry protein [Kushneria phosphatilytica]QEL12623.1 intermembrane transport protein PqiB [Kushneria phosphatilytica]